MSACPNTSSNSTEYFPHSSSLPCMESFIASRFSFAFATFWSSYGFSDFNTASLYASTAFNASPYALDLSSSETISATKAFLYVSP